MAAEQPIIKQSRIGKQPVSLPKGVKVSLDGQTVVVKGPKGELTTTLSEAVTIELSDGELAVKPIDQGRVGRAMHGLSRSLLSNMITGVTDGYTRELEINGVGYRAEKKGSFLLFQLGYSHPILFELPSGIEAEVTARDTRVKLTGIDKQLIGQVASNIRALRKPEPYKGKGIKYVEEVIVRKAGKAAAR